MSVQVKHRRDTALNIAGFTAAQGELIVDTTNNRLIVGDGATAGGFPVAMARRTAVADAAYTALNTDRLVAYTSLTAARTVTLPAASGFPAGETLRIVDESGACSAANVISVSRAGSDTIDGLTAVALAAPYAGLSLESNGSNAWTLLSQTAPLAPSPKGATFGLQWVETQVTLSGASTAISLGVSGVLFAVAARVTTTVTGCTSISLGDTQNGAGHWGTGIGLSVGSTNGQGAPPGGYYSGFTTLSATAVGGAASFSAGALRVSALMGVVTPPTS